MENVDLVWDLRWHRSFYLRELYVYENILSMLQEVILSLKRDKWFWKLFVAHAYQDQFAGSF